MLKSKIHLFLIFSRRTTQIFQLRCRLLLCNLFYIRPLHSIKLAILSLVRRRIFQSFIRFGNGEVIRGLMSVFDAGGVRKFEDVEKGLQRSEGRRGLLEIGIFLRAAVWSGKCKVQLKNIKFVLVDCLF